VATAEAPSKRKAKRTRGLKQPADAVTQYALDVKAGVIVAGRAVRLAAERHLCDLTRERTAAFPYYFDHSAAQHIIDFFPEFLTLENGEPFVLPRWLQFFYGSMFGWKCWGGDSTTSVDPEHAKRAGKRRLLYGFGETSKGSGKTPSLGGIGLYGITFDDEPFAEVYSAGFDKGQASLPLNDAIRMADDPRSELAESEGLEVGKYNIANLRNGSFFRAASSEHRSKSGPRPHMVLGDEIHEHRDGRVINKLTAGFKGRIQPMALLFTNSGSDTTSICWEYHQKSLAVLEGTQTDEQWFAYVCHLDPCDRCFADGYRQPKDGCPDCDDWTDPAVWPKVAPALGVVIQPKYLQDAVDMALSIGSEFNLKRRLNFCIWTQTHQVWISSDRWDACRVSELLPASGVSAVTAAFDMSEKLDLTAGVIARRVNDSPGMQPDIVEVSDVTPDGQETALTLNLNFCVELIPFFWLPEETLRDRVRKERIPFDVWERAGHLRMSKGPIVDHDMIFEQFTREIVPRYRPTIVGYDPHNATQFGAALRDKAKLNAVEVPQGRALSEAFKWFEALVHARRIRHLGNPVLSWCVANCEAKRDRYRNLWVEKPSATKRIDGAIAAVEALKLLMVMPQQPAYEVMIIGRGRR
jgi:phage terminase large subunit-like protein